MVGRHADSVSSTRARDFTGILTFAIVAGCRGRTVSVRKALVRGAALATSIAVGHSAGWALALIGPHCIDTEGSRLTWAVLALVNVHALVNRKEESWLALALGHMVLAGTGAPTAVN